MFQPVQMPELQIQTPDLKKGLDSLPKVSHERFCQAMAQGGISASQAYRVAFNYHGGYADSLSAHLAARDSIKQRINALRHSRNDPLIMSAKERRRTLAAIVRTPISQIDEHSPLAQSVKYSYRRTKRGRRTLEEKEVKVPNKLAAIELDARLAGELDGQGERGKSVRLRIVAQGAGEAAQTLAAELDVD